MVLQQTWTRLKSEQVRSNEGWNERLKSSSNATRCISSTSENIGLFDGSHVLVRQLVRALKHFYFLARNLSIIFRFSSHIKSSNEIVYKTNNTQEIHLYQRFVLDSVQDMTPLICTRLKKNAMLKITYDRKILIVAIFYLNLTTQNLFLSQYKNQDCNSMDSISSVWVSYSKL